jgi:hypothetical protein
VNVTVCEEQNRNDIVITSYVYDVVSTVVWLLSFLIFTLRECNACATRLVWFFPHHKAKGKITFGFYPSQDVDNMDRFPHQKWNIFPIFRVGNWDSSYDNILHVYKAIEHCDVVTHKKLI